ncbi:MAG: hypothetical protein V3T86_18330 [Planctomycetota bacterium]
MRWIIVLVVGVCIGAALPGLLDGSNDGVPARTASESSDGLPGLNVTANPDDAELLARIAELQALIEKLRANPFPKPKEWEADTPESLKKLLEEAYAENNVDWLVEVIRRLLAMGDEGYPILRRLIEDIAFRGKFLPTGADFRVDQAYEFGKIFTNQEEDIIGFLNFLLREKRTIPIMKQIAMMGAAYFVGSKAKGTEELQQTLLQIFMEQGATGGAGAMMGGMPANAAQKMQVFAMAMSGDPAMVGPLRAQLAATKDKGVQGDIIGALAYLGDPTMVPLIKERLDPTKGDFSRELDALGRVGTPEAHDTAAGFLKAIPDSKRFYRHARRYMRSGGGISAVMLMQERIKANPNDPEVARTIGSLRRFPTTESRDTLAFVRDSAGDAKVRKRADDAVQEIDRTLRGEIPERFQAK